MAHVAENFKYIEQRVQNAWKLNMRYLGLVWILRMSSTLQSGGLA